MTALPIAVITGASGGIGSATVDELQQRGYWILAIDRSKPQGARANEAYEVDLGSQSCGERVAAFVDGRPVAALVNNAAIASTTAALDTAVETWDRVINTNLRAPFLLAKALFPNLAAARGAVVNIASVHADATSRGASSYSASKGGLQALTRALAVEWGADGVRINCVLPGAVNTPMLREGLKRTGLTVQELGLRHPLGRVADPMEIARVIAFLVGPESSFVSGAGVTVDGGALARLSTE